MDNLTHSLVGLTAAKAGLERLSPGATTLCVLAANAPDADILAIVFGRWTYLHHHRGITHSIVGTLALALALPLVFYLGDLLRSKIRGMPLRVRLPGLILASLVVTATHPILDWTNNYGVRFLLPWSSKWFYGDFVFVLDPVLWLLLGGAAFLLTASTNKRIAIWVVIALLPSYLILAGPSGPTRIANAGLVRLLWIVAIAALVVLYRRRIGESQGAKVAIVAFAAVIIYCAGLAGAQSLALRQGRIEAMAIANKNGEQMVKVAAMATPANPAEWLCVMETDRATYRFTLSLLRKQQGAADLVRFDKPHASDAAVADALRDERARIFLDFARFPVVKVVGENCATQTLVQFADLRYTEPGRTRGTFGLEVPVECPAPASN
jgi:inner membrane protein